MGHERQLDCNQSRLARTIGIVSCPHEVTILPLLRPGKRWFVHETACIFHYACMLPRPEALTILIRGLSFGWVPQPSKHH